MMVPTADGRITVVKVRVNEYNKIILDGKVNGKRYRLSTGKEANKRNKEWYSRHCDDEFFKLYKKKYEPDDTGIGKITFEEYGLKILMATSQNRNKFSQKEELQRFNALCKTFGKRGIKTIKASDILAWQNSCGYAYKTKMNYRGTLNQIFKMAYEDELINRNPVSAVAPPKKPIDQAGKPIRTLTEEEIAALIKNAKNPQLRNMLLCNVVMGLRASELIALQWEDIDFERKKIHVRQRIRDGEVDMPKHASFREIDMLPKAYQALMAQKSISKHSIYVFLTQYGKPYKSPDTITKQLKKLCEKCGIEAVTFKTTRKTCNTLYKQYGMNGSWILQQLGHKSEQVNMNHYTGKVQIDSSEFGRVLAGLEI